MGRKSREKGKRGEREAAAALGEALGVEWRRGVQYAGGPDSPDVVCPEMPGLHVEVKRVESLRVYPAMEQAVTDAGPGRVPVILHRRSGREWLLVARLGDVRRLAEIVKSVAEPSVAEPSPPPCQPTSVPVPTLARLLRSGEVARLLGRTPRCVAAMARAGILERVRLGGRRSYGFRERDVLSLLGGGGEKVLPPLSVSPPPTGTRSAPKRIS